MRKKKFLLGGIALLSAFVMLPFFGAFEAHVVNVTAKIENALGVPVRSIDFGTVFPQEHLDQPLEIRLSQSFLDEDRVDDIDYIIRQKPKCAITSEDGTSFDPTSTQTGHVMIGDNPNTPEVVEESWIDCGEPSRPLETGEVYGLLPSLCEYISKEGEDQNDGTTPSFHQPWEIVDGEVVWLDTPGRLAKSEEDIVDLWNIDLAVPCFGNFCAQDWEEFVEGINPDALPADQWTQPIENEHKIYGCDLWIEVAGVSLTPGSGELIVTKTVVNDDDGTATTTDFSYAIDGGTPTAFEADGSNSEFVSAGDHVVSEPAVEGYTATFGGDCDAAGNVTVPDGGIATCTITNDDNGTATADTTLVVTKVVVNDDNGTATTTDFVFNVDGGADIPFEADGSNEFIVSAGAHTVTEPAVAGYTASFGGDCDDAGNINVPDGGTAECIITNDDNAAFGTLTVFKIVDNGDGGLATTTDFDLFADGTQVQSGDANEFAPGAYTVSETGVAGYQATFTGDCDATGNITIVDGGDHTCTISNNDIAPNITLNKEVINDDGGELSANDFDMFVNGTPVPNGSSIVVEANTDLEITEDPVEGYATAGISGAGCPSTLGELFQMDLAESITCTITNDDEPAA